MNGITPIKICQYTDKIPLEMISNIIVYSQILIGKENLKLSFYLKGFNYYQNS